MNSELNSLLSELEAAISSKALSLARLQSQLSASPKGPETRLSEAASKELALQVSQSFSELSSLTSSLEAIKKAQALTTSNPVDSIPSSNRIVVPPNLPTINFANSGSMSVYDFLDIFEARLVSVDCSSRFWPQLLLNCVPCDDLATLHWLKEGIIQLPWPEARIAFIAHFDSPNAQRRYLRDFHAVRMIENESFIHFCDRYRMLAERARVDVNDIDCRDRFLACLPPALTQNLLLSAYNATTFSALADQAIALEAMLASIEAYSVSNTSKLPLPTAAASVSSFPSPGSLFCRYCKSKDHYIEDCKKRAAKNAASSSFRPNSSSSHGNSPTFRANSFRGSSDSKPSPANPTIALVATPEDAVNSQDVLNAPVCASITSSPSSNNSNSVPISNFPDLISFPFLVNAHEITAHLDTGSQISILDTRLAQELNLKIVPSSLLLEQAQHGATMSVVGVVENLSVALNSFSFLQNFIVANLQSRFRCILGMDVFKKLNLFIGGFPSCINKSDSEDDLSLVQPSLDSEAPPSVEDSEFILSRIQPLLSVNAATVSHFCNLPNSVVTLPTADHMPSWVSQYSLPRNLHSVVEEQIQSWLDSGVIVPTSPGCSWNSPLLVVKKQLNPLSPIKFRVCIDPRHLNAKLAEDKFPIPILRTLLDLTSGASIFSSLDLAASYHQFLIHEDDQVKTSFTWKNNQFMFQGAPFGLKTLTSVFQRVMRQLFSDFPFVINFIDDILVFSPNLDLHASHLEAVINRLTSANLTLNVAKCKFGFSKIRILGHFLSAQGIAVDFEKFPNVESFPIPTSKRDLQSFLGLLNYFRDFIPQFAFIAQPLNAIREEDKICLLWNDQHQRSFLLLKEALMRAPILSFPDYDMPFYVATDASSFAIGATLFQCDELNFSIENRRFIKFASRSLRAHELKYPASKRELLAIVFALQKFNDYLCGQAFTVVTDHKPLSFLFSQKHLSELQYSWLETILKHNFEIVYCPGHLNVLPDLLSRLYPDASLSNTLSMETHSPSATAAAIAAPQSSDELASSLSDDESLSLLPSDDFLFADPSEDQPSASTPAASHSAAPLSFSQPQSSSSNTEPTDREDLLKAAIKYGKKIPEELERSNILRDEHLLNHCCPNTLYSNVLKRGFFWPSLAQDCQTLCDSCSACQRFTIAKKGYHPQSSVSAILPMDHVAVDTLGPLPVVSHGMAYVLVLIDVFTRFIFLRAMPDKSALTVSRVLYDWFCLFGHPKVIQSDNGTEFINNVISELSLLYGWHHRKVVPYHPQGNGIAERAVQTSLNHLRKSLDGSIGNWALLIPALQLKINQRTTAIHRSTPFDVMFARSLNPFMEFPPSDSSLAVPSDALILDRLNSISTVIFPEIAALEKRSIEKRNARWNKAHKSNVSFAVGATVMAKNVANKHKLEFQYLGPYKIVARTQGGSYRLSDASQNILPRNFPPCHLKLIPSASLTNSFFVEAILDSKLVKGKRLFKTRWFGYLPEQDTWEPADSFDDPAIVENFLANQNLGGE